MKSCSTNLHWIIKSFFLFIIPITKLYAIEIYTVVTDKCSSTRGIIIDSSEDSFSMISLDGKFSKVKTSDVSIIFIHNLTNNPITSISFSPENLNRLRHVYVGTKDKPLFTGWSISFIENLVVFYDLDGQIHIIDLEKILKIRPLSKQEQDKLAITPKRTLQSSPVNFGMDASLTNCENLNKQGVQPIRILADKIRIGDFHTSFLRGFDKIDSFEERTYFYAKPYLFDKKTRMGFMSYSNPHEQPSAPGNKVPIYFQWSTGTEYRFQSLNVFGKQVTPDTPSLEPMMAFKSELKSHIFHGEFIGNLNALSAGTEYYTSYSTDYSDVESKKKTIADNHSRSAMSFNYMAIMGLDYDSFSFSYGTFFPIHYLEFGSSFREILGSSPSPLVRFMYTFDKGQLRALLGWTEYNILQPNDYQITFSKDSSVIGQMNQFKLSSKFLRVGAYYDLSDTMRIHSDWLLANGDYSETLTSNGTVNTMKFQNMTLSGGVRFSFGDYVSLGVFMNMLNNKQDYLYLGNSGSHTLQDNVTGGSFEFIF